ncbi:MAG TPA: porin [Burkholderiaceae bacterium]|nr:porin [Burkholderiaceae bacterium]
MKKSLLALAALGAFASAASAQSSVTLSGGIDVSVVRANGAWEMGSGNSGRSNFTLSGTEDLGGGMSAYFSLNHRFRAADGTITSQPGVGRFYRQSWVGLKGGFGDLRLGRMLPVLQIYNGDFDPFGTETIGSTHTGGVNAGLAGSSRNNNNIMYTTPNLGGLTISANIAAADQNGAPTATAMTNGTERPMGIGANYAAGPLRLAVAYDRNSKDQKTTGLYGLYNLGVATVMAQWEKGDISATADVSRWSVGTRVPMGAATFKAGYMKWSDENKKKFGLGVDYNLSKRTIVYTDVGKTSGSGFTSTQNKAQFDVGIWHKF